MKTKIAQVLLDIDLFMIRMLRNRFYFIITFLLWSSKLRVIQETNQSIDLDEEPFTGNTLVYPHGQPTVLQPKEHGIHNLRLFIKAAQRFINVFWVSWMRNMPPQLLLRSKWFRPRKKLKEGD